MLGVVRQLAPLDLELALDQVVLRRRRETHSPAAMRDAAGDRAGETGQPDDRRRRRPTPANPRISDTFETRPSLTPNTDARARPPATER